MPLDPNPIYRKEIVPWYDSEIACFVLMVLMDAVLLFGAVGIGVAHQQPAYRPYLWVPLAVVLMSAGVLCSTASRVIKRYFRRISD